MTSSVPVHKVWFDRATSTALNEFAWRNRTSAGKVIRHTIDDIIANPTDTTVLSDTDGLSQIQKSVRVESDVWTAARRAASTADMSVNAMIRRRIRKLLEDEGFLV